MKKSITMFVGDEVCEKHLNSLYRILNVYCHGLHREGYIKPNWQISIEENSCPDLGGIKLIAAVEVIRPGNLPFFDAYKRHSAFLGATNQSIINHVK